MLRRLPLSYIDSFSSGGGLKEGQHGEVAIPYYWYNTTDFRNKIEQETHFYYGVMEKKTILCSIL